MRLRVAFHALLLGIALVPQMAAAADPCPTAAAASLDGVLVAWNTDIRGTSDGNGGRVTVGPFRSLAVIRDGSLGKTVGATIFKDQPFWRATDPQRAPVKLSSANSFLDHMGEDHCVYHATLSDPSLPKWTLLTSKPLPGVFKPPTAPQVQLFSQSRCIVQGDHETGKEPPCTKPQVLAVSDINGNGRPEYWVTNPYMWDTGVTVWEESDGMRPLLLDVCTGCSD